MADITILTAQFGESGVEVTYLEERDQAEKATLIRSIMLSADLVAVELQEIMDLLQDAVDKGILHIQAVPDSLPANRPRPRERPRQSDE